ncbi:hypothetical protein QN277_029272 [Acacia crassicarpa]|uniref:PLAT domain-containing protein n=1 Tax=Acacia crassicarpa TaxID=499986 RepID=A0AAE1MKP0_9FABA|nr:hypothetical protein QN277_029272 [Acacia crassicarpa]
MALRVIALSASLVFLLSLTLVTSDECYYLVSVQTGDRADAGTDATISLKLFNSSGGSITVPNLEDWGLMESGHDYFERGNLDLFGHSAPCIDVCGITVTSDNSGNKPGWYLDSVEVIVSGSISKKAAFPVNQWLALDEYPYSLSATVDLCSFISLKSTLSSV